MQNEYKYQTYHDRKAQEWLQIITDCKSSGMKVDDWCDAHNVNPKNYWRWHKKLKDECLLSINEKEHAVSSSTVIDNPEIYAVPVIEGRTNKRNAVVSINAGSVSVDVYSENASFIISLVRGLSIC